MTREEIEQAAREYVAWGYGCDGDTAADSFIKGAEFVLKRAEKLIDALSSVVETYHFDKTDLGRGSCAECDHGWAGEQVDEYKHDLNCPFSILSRSLKEWRGEK